MGRVILSNLIKNDGILGGSNLINILKKYDDYINKIQEDDALYYGLKKGVFNDTLNNSESYDEDYYSDNKFDVYHLENSTYTYSNIFSLIKDFENYINVWLRNNFELLNEEMIYLNGNIPSKDECFSDDFKQISECNNYYEYFGISNDNPEALLYHISSLNEFSHTTQEQIILTSKIITANLYNIFFKRRFIPTYYSKEYYSKIDILTILEIYDLCKEICTLLSMIYTFSADFNDSYNRRLTRHFHYASFSYLAEKLDKIFDINYQKEKLAIN